MLAVDFRAVTMILGGIVLVAAGYEAMRYACKYHHTKAPLARWRAVQRLGTLLGVVFILGELGERAGSHTITWRSPLAFCVFCLVLVSIVAIDRAH